MGSRTTPGVADADDKPGSLGADARTRDITLTRANVDNLRLERPMVISAANWRCPRSRAEGRARLIGRAKYNAWRRELAGQRREAVRELLLTLGWDRWGVLGEIATQLGVSRSCVCRDRQRLERWGGGEMHAGILGRGQPD